MTAVSNDIFYYHNISHTGAVSRGIKYSIPKTKPAKATSSFYNHIITNMIP